MCQHCLHLGSCFLLLHVYTPLYLKKFATCPLSWHSLGDRCQSSSDAPNGPALHLHPRGFIFLTADSSAPEGLSALSSGINTFLSLRKAVTHTPHAHICLFHGCMISLLLSYSPLDALIHLGLSLLCLFQTDKLPASNGNSCY